MKYEALTIENIGDGVLSELFAREMKTIVKNMSDNNTELAPARELNIKIKLKPNPERDYAAVSIKCSSKLAPVKLVESSIVFEGDQSFYKTGKEVELFPENVTAIEEQKNA
jgi:hypothetical protein